MRRWKKADAIAASSAKKNGKMAQLNQRQRHAIYLYVKEKRTQAYIAGRLNVSESTISRKPKRNVGERGYS